MSREVLLYPLFDQRPMASCAPSKSRTTFTWNWKVRLAGIDRTTMKSVSVLETTIKFDFLHRSVWLPPASSSADTTFEENIGQTFPTDLGDEGPFLGTIRAGRNRQGGQDGALGGIVGESAFKTGRPSILLRDQQSLFHLPEIVYHVDRFFRVFNSEDAPP